jgi:curli biogenesis system outer membrane secretion channel CsgG
MAIKEEGGMEKIQIRILVFGLAVLLVGGLIATSSAQMLACEWDDQDCMDRNDGIIRKEDKPSEPVLPPSTRPTTSSHPTTSTNPTNAAVGNQGTQGNDNDPSFRIVNQPVPQVKGPKRTVSVGKFDAIGSFTNQYGGWDVGGGLSAMMVRALQETNRFIVLERANISQIMSEQEMKGQKLVHKGSGPQLGKLIGVNFMIYGSVTEFGAQDKGSGFSLGGSGGFGGMLGGAVSQQSTSGSVAMDIRIVDTTTSEILETYTVREETKGSSFDLSLTVKQISAGHNQFMKTPLGETTRRCLNRAVQLIAKKANDIPWTGKVVAFEDNELYVNAGTDSGVNAGDRFKVTRITKQFTDPETGKILGQRKKILGSVELTGVEKKLSYGTFLPLADLKPERGDMLTVMEGN